MSETSGIERRLVMRLLNHWRDLGEYEKMPAFEDIDPDAIPDIWPHCFIIALPKPGSPPDTPPLLKAIGDQLREDYGGDEDLVGQPVTALDEDTLLGRALSHYPMLLAKGVPVSLGDTFIHRDGREILYRSIVVPLSDNGEEITHILGAANHREMEKG